MHVSWRWLSLLTGVLIAGPVRPGLLAAQQAVTIAGRVTNEAARHSRSRRSTSKPWASAPRRLRTAIPAHRPGCARHRPAGHPRRSRDRLPQHRPGHADGRHDLEGLHARRQPAATRRSRRHRLRHVDDRREARQRHQLGQIRGVQKSNEPNIVNALAAKAPGVEVTSQSGDPGAGSSIIIRGLKTIQGDGQPLFVIDGQPIDNSTLTTERLRRGHRNTQSRGRHQP